MEIMVAEGAGACFGVRRALSMATEAAKSGSVFTLGPLIHNERVVQQLQELGVRVIESVDQIVEGTLVIRSHGVPPGVLEAARAKGLQVIDATCPFVRKAQELAANLAAEGYAVIVVGDRDHPEVAGLVGWAGGGAQVVESREQADHLASQARIGVVSQTTQPVEVFYQVVEALIRKAPEVKIHNTICHATRLRQEQARNLARRVGVMVVVGGGNSANTAKLTRISRETGTPTYQIQSAAELEEKWFLGLECAGVTAGASTPEWIIEEVVTKMSQIAEDTPREDQGIEPVETASPETANEEVVVPDDAGTVEPVTVEAQTAEGSTAAAEEGGDRMDTGLEESLKPLQEGEVVTGTIVQVNDSEVLVDVGGKSEGVIPLNELSNKNLGSAREAVQVGDMIQVYILKVENAEGHPVLSRKRAVQAEALDSVEEAFTNGQVVEGEVIAVVKGGVVVDIGMRGFVPASLLERGYVANLGDFVGKTLGFKVIEFDRSKGKAVLSRKALLEEERARAQAEIWEHLNEGQIVHGVVRHLTKFGAFIDLGGVDGLLHISEMSWTRINDPSDVLQEGDEVDVTVLGIDTERKRISLGLKQILPSPWEQAAAKYSVGETVMGKIVRIVPFGAFVQVEPGVEGLVHISQLAPQRVAKPEDVISVGEELPVKILDIQAENKRMSLSIKEAAAEKEAEEANEYTGNQEKASGGTIGDRFPDGFPGSGAPEAEQEVGSSEPEAADSPMPESPEAESPETE